MLFTICDEFNYYEEKPLPPDDKCSIRYIPADRVKQTVLRQCCPLMVSVVIGEANTLREKLVMIFNSSNGMLGNSFNLFYERMARYGMSKYILSRLLYGKWDINYLLRSNNDKFLDDLGKSRFCNFVRLFEDCNSSNKVINKTYTLVNVYI